MAAHSTDIEGKATVDFKDPSLSMENDHNCESVSCTVPSFSKHYHDTVIVSVYWRKDRIQHFTQSIRQHKVCFSAPACPTSDEATNGKKNPSSF